MGNLSFDSTEADVKKLFEGFGNVASAVVVMEKEKKAPKSRGFGFVQMPDEQQALAAIAALNSKEFMGRVLNVNPARPKGQKAMVWSPIAKAKTEAQAASELKEKRQPGTYKGGRRSRSYMKQHGLTGMEDTKPRRRSQDNPMRWRKRKDQPKPWQRSPDEHKPWKKAEEGARPWKKAEGESKPWKKTGGEIRTWRKSGEEPKPWKKLAGEAKHWRKGRERPQKSRFNPSTSSFDKLRTNPERVKRVEGSLGMVRGNGERPSTTLRTALSERSESNGRSRTKSRGKPGGYKR